MKHRSGFIIGAIAFLIWEMLCSFVCFGARGYMARPVTSVYLLMACASALGILVALGLAMSARAVERPT